MAYALEGSVFVSGAGVQWLRDGLGVIDHAADLEPLARSVDSSEGVVVVPAFTGLGSPHWDPGARGTILGLSRGTGRAHLARAMVEAMGFQVRDVIEAMADGPTAPSVLRVDGGASAMDLLLELVADQVQLDVVRPRSVETTAIGAATLAGLAEGLWGSLDELAGLWTEERAFAPGATPADTESGPPGLAARRRPVPALGRRGRHDRTPLVPGRQAHRRRAGQPSSCHPWSASSAMIDDPLPLPVPEDRMAAPDHQDRGRPRPGRRWPPNRRRGLRPAAGSWPAGPR